MPEVRGRFDVQMIPQPPDDYADMTSMGRMTLDKQYHGALEATSKGQMLTGMGGVKGSAGYVAMERITGVLDGRRGSFIAQHSGQMARGVQSLVLTIVPDSGTDELTGLQGEMGIEITDGKHWYSLRYQLES